MKRILIIGCGLAGLSAAVKSAQSGNEVIMISPAPSERTQSVMAMGGINAALNTKGQDDSVEQHFQDTMKSGAGICCSKAVKQMTNDAPEIIKWLSDMGASFTRDEHGNVDLRYFGGQKKMRTAYAGARTGKQLVTALTAECRKYEAKGLVKRMTGWRLLSFAMTSQGACAGAVFFEEHTEEIKQIEADAVILASGGPNRVFGKTTGSLHCDGSAAGQALMQGVTLGNPEMIQYHPTTIDTPVKRMLITEAARGQGGRLYTIRDGKPWYFMEEWYPEFGALMPRDVVSRSIFKVCSHMGLGIDGENKVYLDITFLPEDVISVKLDEVVNVCKRYLHLNPAKELIPVYPGVHYFMGGIKTDERHQTNIPRLFAAGECSCQYHGANRLGGNSLLGAIHGGWMAAVAGNELESLNGKQKQQALSEQKSEEMKRYQSWKQQRKWNGSDTWKAEEQLASIMKGSMGIYRNEKQLKQALQQLKALYKICPDCNSRGNYYEYRRLPAMIVMAEAMVKGALERRESRGAHQREEYPDTNDKEFRKITCVSWNNEGISIDFEAEGDEEA